MQTSAAATAVFWLIALYIVHITISGFLAARRNATKAHSLGCKEPQLEKNWWPLGIDNLMRTFAADRAHQFPNDLMKRFEEKNTYTYRYSLLGRQSRFTLILHKVVDRALFQGLGTSAQRIPRISKPSLLIDLPTLVSTASHLAPVRN